ncbi:MAG: rod shape-determining protein MreC [Oscillospiraceae bacterium]|jgi:rod shape-determining protein MreC|nr:rod shape-determining protein MreC [Oscillospiraceae bacterium]
MAIQQAQKLQKQERSGGQKFLRVMLVVLLLALMGLAGYSQYVQKTFLPENVLVTVITPVHGFFAGIARGISDYVARVKLRSNIEYEYNLIKAQNDRLMYDALFVEELQNEVDRLTALLGAQEANSGMDPLVAQVIQSAPGNWFSTFMLNKGSADGVGVNMAVITASGLIGHVYEVYANTCKVITIIDSDSNIAGLIESSRDQGILRGTLGIDGQPMCRMYYLPASSVPRPGDSVITSGIGLPFPKGLVMGTVRESTRSLDENKYYIVVEPVADFKHIEEVLILRYQPEAQEMPESQNSDGIEIMAVPTALPQTTISNSQLNATPPPLPGAPGRSGPTPAPGETVQPDQAASAQDTPAPSAGEDLLGDDDMSPEERQMREQFLNGN